MLTIHSLCLPRGIRLFFFFFNGFVGKNWRRAQSKLTDLDTEDPVDVWSLFAFSMWLNPPCLSRYNVLLIVLTGLTLAGFHLFSALVNTANFPLTTFFLQQWIFCHWSPWGRQLGNASQRGREQVHCHCSFKQFFRNTSSFSLVCSLGC